MKRFKRMLSCAVVLMLVTPSSHAWYRVPPRKPLVQMAILLDTSNSMDGLIEQAKSQLWRIANDLAYSTRYGERPTLEVALYEYGNNWLSAGERYIRQVLPFTTDMDRVSEKLFSLRTNGGEEYCGAVIKDAINGLAWDTRDEVYKVIFIAGNEPFTQGPVYFRDAIAQAVSKGIVVNPIFCGAYGEGVQTQWYDGAVAGRGAYLTIDPNMAIVVLPTPYDVEIQQLGYAINETYVGYGVRGRKAIAAQASADSLAAAMPASGAPVERSLYKASPQYSANSWDVVSNVTAGRMKVAELERKDLPVKLQAKSTAELQVYLKDQQDKRSSLQSRLEELKKSREDFLAKKQAEQSPGGAMSLDQAMRKVIREQAGRMKFTFAPSGQ